MTVPKWAPSTLYQPGDIVQPRLSGPITNQAIVNSSFESGDTAWAKSNATITNSGVTPFAGTWCAKMVYAAGANGSVTISTALPVAPGQTVSASCMMNPSGAAIGVGGQVRLIWLDASNATISSVTGNVIDVSNGAGWRKSFVSQVAPANAAKFKIQGEAYNGNASGVVLWDSFTLTVNGGAAGNSYIFEATQADPATSAASEPVWPTTLGGTVVDGGVTWTAIDATVVTWQASPILKSGSVEPTWPTQVGEFVSDGTIAWEAISRRIEDPNCPQSKIVLILSSKVFAADGDIVRFCATANPKDWTSEQDAGYLPTGLQSANANDIAVLAQYRSNLTAFNASSFQNWQVDPDPEAMASLDQMEGIGSTWNKAAQPVANDLFYLSQLGVRSIGIAASTDNLSAGDVGMPIDELVQQAVAVAEANGSRVLSTYYPAAGQYWLTFAEYPANALSPISGDIADGYIGDSGTATFTVSGGVGPYSFSVSAGSLPPGKLLSTAGVASGTFVGEGDSVAFHDYALTIKATDSSGASVTKDITVRVTNFSISGSIPDGPLGSTGSGSFSNSHGIAPFTYSVLSGALPTGMVLDADGSYTYTYTEGGDFSAVIKCVDANGNIATLSVSATVAATYGTWEPMTMPDSGSASLTNSGATYSASANVNGSIYSTVPIRQKSYFEIELDTAVTYIYGGVGCGSYNRRDTGTLKNGSGAVCVECPTGIVYANNTSLGTLSAGTGSTMRVRIAVDPATRNIWLGAVGMTGWVGGGDPTAGTTPTITLPGSGLLWAAASLNDIGTATLVSDPADLTGSAPSGFFAGLTDTSSEGTYTTIDPENSHPNNALSNGNLTVTNTVSSAAVYYSTCKRIKRTGKAYWEITAKNNGTESCMWGVSREGSDYYKVLHPTRWLRAIAIQGDGYPRIGSGSGARLFSSIYTGDVLRFKFDIDAGTLEVAVNGSAFSTLATGITGAGWRVGLGAYNGVYGPEGGTFNFGASPFVYSVPSGYDAGWLADP